MTIAAIILAAGESSRMGRLKQLLPWGGKTLLAWQVGQARAAGADDVVVVLGHEASRIRDEAGDLEARIVINEGYREGRASSLRRGAEAVADGVEAVLVLSVDQPRPESVLTALVDAWRDGRPLLAMPAYRGRRGHPVLADGALLAELRLVTEEGLGLREVTERHRDETAVIEIDNPVVNLDLNTPADYATAFRTYASR